QPFDVVGTCFLVTGNHQPASTVTTCAVALGQGVEGQGQHVGRQAAQRCVLHVVKQDLVVDFVGQQDQIEFAGNIDQGLQHRVRIEHAGRVVRVDDHQALGAGSDLGTDIVQVRNPAVGLVAQIMDGCTAGQAGNRCPQRVVGHGQEQFVAIIQQS